MYDNYNYPPGADGPDAPWNQEPEVEHTRVVSLTISFKYTTTGPKDADEESIKEWVDDEVRELIKKNSISKLDEFCIDELEVIDD